MGCLISFITEPIHAHDKERADIFENKAKEINFVAFNKIELEGGPVVFSGVIKTSGDISFELCDLNTESEVRMAWVSDEGRSDVIE